MKIKGFMAIFLVFCMVFAFVACAEKGQTNDNGKEETKAETTAAENTNKGENAKVDVADGADTDVETEADKAVTDHPKATVVMENGGQFVIELYPEYAPKTVENFIALAESGFYNGVGFHRIVDGFMAQGGDPDGTGMGGSDKTIPGEFASNGFKKNTLSHTRGVVSMARSAMPDSASSQFFICYDDASFLDGEYAAFGKVVEGMDVVDGFLAVERVANAMGEKASPVTPIVMKSVTVER